MSYDDGDVSMASFRDESFNMSVDNDTIDVVWHSTQQPAIQSILEESKLHQRRKSPSAWDPNQTPLITGVATAPKSLFKDASTPRTVSLLGSHSNADTLPAQVRSRPGMGRVTSSPSLPANHPSKSFSTPSGSSTIDPRKIRPSQRQTLQAVVTSGKAGHETNSQIHATGSIENLDHLREMIKSVGRTWGKADSAPVSPVDFGSKASTSRPPSRTKQARTVGANGDTSHPATSSDEIQRQLYRDRSRKPKIATTIKVLKIPPHLQGASSRQNDPKGLMLPPALPSQHNPSEVSNLQFPSKSPVEAGERPQQIDTSMQLDSGDDDSPDTPTYKNRSLSPCRNPSLLESSQIRRSSIPPDTVSKPRPPERSATTMTASQSQSQKVLGMRRTLSGNRFEPSSSQQAPSRQTKHSLPAIPARSASYPVIPAIEAPFSASDIPLPPEDMRVSSELASRSKSFKVPWASQTGSTSQQKIVSSSSQQQPPNSQSPTTSVSSSSPHSGLGAGTIAQAFAIVQPEETRDHGDLVMDYAVTENPDSSYSFDDFDPDELDQVLSQRGA